MATEIINHEVRLNHFQRGQHNSYIHLGLPVTYSTNGTSVSSLYNYFAICTDGTNNYGIYTFNSYNTDHCDDTVSFFANDSQYQAFLTMLPFLASKFDPAVIPSTSFYYEIKKDSDGLCYLDFDGNPNFSVPANLSPGSTGCISKDASTHYPYIYGKYTEQLEVTVPDPVGGSYDDTNLVNAVLMIPSVLLVVCFFSAIYKIFINRRLRG